MIKIYNHFISRAVFLLLIVEFAILVSSFYAAAAIRFQDSNYISSPKYENFFLSACVFASLMMLSMSAFGMYEQNFKEDIWRILLRLMPSLALGFCITTLIFYLMPDLYVGRGILGLGIILAGAGVFFARFFAVNFANIRFLRSRILILGVDRLAKDCGDLASKFHGSHYKVIGFVPMEGEECRVPLSAILPSNKPLLFLAEKYRASEIIVAVRNRRDGSFSGTGGLSHLTQPNARKPISELLACKLAGIHVTDAATFFEREASYIRLDSLQPSWFVFGGGFDQGELRTSIKRIFDLSASVVLLVVGLPIMVITAFCILVEDGNPIFYRQERVGLNGKHFVVLKFRSMRHDAEHMGKPQWASENDPRITRVGKIIRRVRIDELPQIINVLKGEMSFVGPRPERPFFVQRLNKIIPYYSMRHNVKPGITGWAQVRYQYGASIEDAIQKLQFDLYYVKNNSLFLDILILINTVQVILLGKGGR
jgi:sugar transferase (PEP-CTERM system associated)